MVIIRVLFLSDGQGWIVDSIAEEMRKRIPDFDIDYYTRLSSNDLLELSKNYDIIHYGNWDTVRHMKVLPKLNVPLIISVRSHRYPEYVRSLEPTLFHVINPDLKKEFANSIYIPDAVFDEFFEKEFVVGMAFNKISVEYKGYPLVKKACDELGVSLRIANGELNRTQMIEFYKSISLYVCASVAEGNSSPVMECLALNRPVLTTDVGIPKQFNVDKCERSVESIKEGILRHYTHNLVKDYSYDNTCKYFRDMYSNVHSGKPSKNFGECLNDSDDSWSTRIRQEFNKLKRCM